MYLWTLAFISYFAVLQPLYAGEPADFISKFATPSQNLEAIFHEKPGVIFGVKAQEPELFQKNASHPFKPASISKLFTAVAMLNAFGTQYRYDTHIQWKASTDEPQIAFQLKLVGSGDPSWGLEDFGENYLTRIRGIAAELKNRGITQVKGPLLIEAADSRFINPAIPEGWESYDRNECYGALAQSFNLNLNCATYILNARRNGHFVEEDVPLRVVLNIGKGSHTFLEAHRESYGFSISGTWGPGVQTATFYFPVDRVHEWIERLLKRALNDQGIELTEASPPSFNLPEKEVSYDLTLQSPNLGEMLKPFLKFSLNLMGDSFFRLIGAKISANEPNLAIAGQEALQNLIAQLGISPADTFLYDGSGLSRKSRVTPDALYLFLENVAKRADFEALWDALPIAGVDGTLEKRMKGTAAQGLLRGKTGTLNDTFNLAGYIPRVENTGRVTGYTPFVMLSQASPSLANSVHQTEDQAGAYLAQKSSIHWTFEAPPFTINSSHEDDSPIFNAGRYDAPRPPLLRR